MDGILAGDFLFLAVGLGLLLVVAFILAAVLFNQKGDVYERSMSDAASYTEYYQKARSGKNTGTDKVHNASVVFLKREGAILSKNILAALKGREYFQMRDVLVIGIYLAMAIIMGMDYLVFNSMLMFWMFFTASNNSLVEELQHHYVYLIPGNALRKLLYSLLVPVLKSALTLVTSLVVGGLLLGADLQGILTALMICLSMLLVIMAGNVLSLRLMKSRTNKMVEQMLRMLLAAAAMLPGAVLFFVIQIALGGFVQTLAGPIFSAVNLLFASIILLACSPMMQGNEPNAD